MKLTSARRPATRRTGPRAPSAWLRQHRASIRDTIQAIRQNLSGVVLSALVIGVSLALPLGLHVLQANFVALTDELGAVPEVSLFLEPSATRAMADSIATDLALDDRIRSARVIDKDAALAAITADADLGAAADSLATNPLPWAIALEVDRSVFDGAAGDAFQAELSTLPGVDEALFDIAWIRRLEAISALIARIAVIVASIFGIGVVLITGNTIRLGIQNRRDEIEVLKLCGATDAYVSRPFLYSGAVQGFAGAMLACVVVVIAVALVAPSVDRLALAYGTSIELANLSVGAALTALGAGAAMGWCGALAAVTVYLKRLDRALAQ